MENKEKGWLGDLFVNRSIEKKQKEIELLKLEIVKAKLEKELEEIKNSLVLRPGELK